MKKNLRQVLWWWFLATIALVLLLECQPSLAQQQGQPPLETDGPQSLALGKQLREERQYDAAAAALWRAVILHSGTPEAQTYDVQEVFQLFMQCYMVQDRRAEISRRDGSSGKATTILFIHHQG